MQRSQGWERKLRCFIEAAQLGAFAWGTNDCCSNVCDWIRLATGEDVYAEFRGQYADAASAAALIRKVTGAAVGSVESAAVYITAKYGMAEIAPKLAQRGDVVLFEGTEGQMLGLVSLHPSRSVFLQEQGLLYLRTDACRRAWRG